MRFGLKAAAFYGLLYATTAFAQTGSGTITGTISDPAGAVVPNAPVEVKNTQTSAVYTAASSGTGNYTIAELPAGTYELSITAPGFKKFVQENILIPVSQTVRVDAALQVGAASESVTVTSEAALLKTESGELSHNIQGDNLDELPVLTIGNSATGLRNPYAELNLIPGTTYTPDSVIRVNGMPSNTESLKVEGQDATTGLWYTQSWTQSSVDAIQEVAIQTSNYAAEFGQAGGGVFNTTMRSGTNQYHGSAYEYFTNEALNSAQPFVNAKPRTRQNDFGFTLGGPVRIPKVYNGTNRTFFFFSFEEYRNIQVINNVENTVPTLAMRQGNFSQIPHYAIGTDPYTGQTVLANTIYNPTSDMVVSGVTERTPFPNNTIPVSMFDPLAAKIQSFFPLPSGPGINSTGNNNYLPTYANPKDSGIPSIKIDQTLSDKAKLAVFWQRTGLNTPNHDGLPEPISSARGQYNVTNTERVNFDYTISPTLLYHAGIGLLDLNYQETVPPFNVETGLATPGAPNGLTGTYDPNYFPTIGGLNGGFGGGPNSGLGAFTHAQVINIKPTANTSLTWVKANHTYKFGGEMVIDGYINHNLTYAIPWITFAAGETSDPALLGVPLTGTAGYGYASFLLGRVDNGYTAVPTDTRLGKKALGFFAQDSWKITRKLTLDYGLRYDYQTYLKADDGIQPNMSPSTPNPGAGNLPGGTVFEATCKCNFSKNYPYAFGPRLGLAYQFLPKFVLRAGFGVSYSKTASDNFQSYAVGGNTPYNSPSFGFPAYQLSNGLPYVVTFPNFNPGQYPVNGIPAGTLNFFDQNAGRPARITQWSIGIQRELPSSIVVEATYVGNRGVWWQANTAVNDNAIQPALLAAGHDGLTPTTLDPITGKTLLTEPLRTVLAEPSVASQYNITLPYAQFPTTNSVFQAVRPFPEYTSILRLWNPDGDTWYNALQIKATKRFSHGLQFSSAFTWSKNEMNGSEGDANFFQAIATAENDVFNRKIDKYLSGFDQPYAFLFNATYTVPKIGTNKWMNTLVRDWQIGAVLRYQSGLPIRVPTANNALSSVLGESTFADPTGQPFFLKDPNCGCFDPNTTFILNPAAWAQPPAGQFGTAAAYYTNYRAERIPTENMNIARNFRVKERYVLQIRAEFTNIFNRVVLNPPSSTNAQAPDVANVNGVAGTGSGFGYINTTTTAEPPRAGQLVARFTF